MLYKIKLYIYIDPSPMNPMGDVLVLFFLVAVGSCNEWRRNISGGIVLLCSGLGVRFVDMVQKWQCKKLSKLLD